MLPHGGGEVILKCPVRKGTRPINLSDGGMVKRVRGTAYALRVSPAIANRMVETAKGVMLNFIPDVFITTDQLRGKQSGKSPGFGIHLYAETTNDVVYSAEQVIKTYCNNLYEFSNFSLLKLKYVDFFKLFQYLRSFCHLKIFFRYLNISSTTKNPLFQKIWEKQLPKGY